MIQVIHRAINILEFIAQNPDLPKGLGTIAVAMKLNIATCARILKTLVNAGYIEQVAPKKGYTLGPMAYALASCGQYRKELINLAAPLMTALAQKMRATVVLAVLRNGRRLVLNQIEPDSDLSVATQLFQTYNPYRSATGRLLLAYLSDHELKAIINLYGLPGRNWPEADDHLRLKTFLENIRANGEALRFNSEVVGVAMPVWQAQTVIAALGLFLPEVCFTENRAAILRQIKKAAQRLSSRCAGGIRAYVGQIDCSKTKKKGETDNERTGSQKLRAGTRRRSGGHCAD